MASKEEKNNEWAKLNGDVHYSKYLQLDKITGALETTSEVHDEHLFVVIHQVYELWFKQLHYEIESICKEFDKGKDTNFLVIVTRLDRITKILKLLVEQIRILETMSPQDFLEFRGKLAPASGFQSCQFRIIEYRIGFNEKRRTKHPDDKKECEYFKQVMSEEERDRMRAAKDKENESLFAYVQKWLENLPGLVEFSEKYEKAMKKMIDEEKQSKKGDENYQKKIKEKEQYYESLIKESEHDEILKEKKSPRRFSQKAMFGALKIYLYRDEPQFNVPYQILNQLIEMDTLLMKWRYSHVFLVQYQIGNRVGTGGTSGVGYLKETISDEPMFFPDLINMTSFFISKKYFLEP